MLSVPATPAHVNRDGDVFISRDQYLVHCSHSESAVTSSSATCAAAAADESRPQVLQREPWLHEMSALGAARRPVSRWPGLLSAVQSRSSRPTVEQLKKTALQAAPADHCYAGAEDVACDVCTGRKRKAVKSCLVCLASYCEKHLQPHYKSLTFEKHKLVDPTKKLQENICSRHHEVLKMFCRTDQQCICYLCSVEEHKGYDTVSAAAERTESQRELELSQQQIQQRVQDREKDVKLLQQKALDEDEYISSSSYI
ncbi:hypothetical protein F2P81_000087 [Scophthalmus maximus]|uniref:B box-type domain-containing protein n=1 Tax=Scophthalmus maximus TaxID=52904 RepID=A0A6A4TT91_SCOMX|nr:hypothetical protein F2P81_000087 [Scophthalmus maximus]